MGILAGMDLQSRIADKWQWQYYAIAIRTDGRWGSWLLGYLPLAYFGIFKTPCCIAVLPHFFRAVASYCTSGKQLAASSQQPTTRHQLFISAACGLLDAARRSPLPSSFACPLGFWWRPAAAWGSSGSGEILDFGGGVVVDLGSVMSHPREKPQ